MADLLGLDPARIERLRDPARRRDLDPELIWQVVEPVHQGVIVDVGTGVGYLALPFAAKFPAASVYGCDVLPGMLELLRAAAAAEGLANLQCLEMDGIHVPLPDGNADIVVMAQLHHELDHPVELLRDCRRLLGPAGTVAVIDWKDEDSPRGPPPGRRLSELTIRGQLAAAGFRDVESHAVYRYHGFLTAKAT